MCGTMQPSMLLKILGMVLVHTACNDPQREISHGLVLSCDLGAHPCFLLCMCELSHKSQWPAHMCEVRHVLKCFARLDTVSIGALGELEPALLG